MKNAETTIFISSRAFRVKRQWSQNHVFHVLGPPMEPSGARPLFLETPPGASRSAPWSSRGGPQSSQEGPGASKGQIKFTKSACSNPRKYVYLASRDLKKTLSDHFSRLRVPPRDPPVWRPYSSRVPPGPQKGPQERPGTPQEPRGPPRDCAPPPGTFSLDLTEKLIKTSDFLKHMEDF